MCNTKLLLVLIAIVCVVVGEEESTPRSIYKILECQDRFSKLVEVVANFPDVLAALRGGKTGITLFAPNNDAFAELGKLPEGDDLLKMLQYHLVSEVIKLEGHLDKEIFMTWLTEPILGGAQRIKVLQKNNTYAVNDKITVVDRNINATNGLIQVIDTVLLPPPDMFHRLAEQPTKMSIFVDAVALTDMTDILEKQRLTVFVPTNLAFEALSKEERKALFSPAGRTNLTNLLKRHIVPSLIYLGELEQSEVKLQTMEDGVTLTVKKRGDYQFEVNGVNVADNDVFGLNGAMNLVNTILPAKQPKQSHAWNTKGSWMTVLRNIVRMATQIVGAQE